MTFKKINAINYKHETNALDYTFKAGSWQIDLNVLVHLLRYYVQCSFFITLITLWLRYWVLNPTTSHSILQFISKTV